MSKTDKFDTKVNVRKIVILHVDQREKTNIQGRGQLFGSQWH